MFIRRCAVAAAGWLTAGFLFAAGCSGDVGEPTAPKPDAATQPLDLDGLESISVEPADTTLIIEGDEPATEKFTAIGTFTDGSTDDISEHVTFALKDAALGSFTGPQLETGTNRGGKTRVRARAAGVEGNTDVTIVLRKRYADPEADLPGDPGAVFDGAADDEAMSPELVYPAPGVMVPPNLERLEFHIVPPAEADLFELSFESDTADVVVYTSCTEEVNGGCVYQPPSAVWRWVAQSNRGSRTTLTVRAADSAGTGVGAAAPQEVVFSQDDIQGAIYYWTSSQVTPDGAPTAIMRYDFGSNQQEAEVFIDPSDTGDKCVGCHALSPDGSKMFTASGSTGGQVLLTDVGEDEPLVAYDSTPKSAFGAWSPDGSQFVGTYSLEDDSQNVSENGWLSYNLNFFNGDTGQFVETIDVGGTADRPISQPDWSADGERIAFIHMDEMNRTQAFALRASIGIIERDGDGWSDPQYLREPQDEEVHENFFFPAFSPEGDLIAFNRSTCPPDYVLDPNDTENYAFQKENAPCNAHGDDNATLFVMAPEPGAEPVELTRANAPGVLDDREVVMNSFPKWTPFTFQRTGESGTRLHWISFASDRRYGLREAGGAHAGTLIWVAGVNPDLARGGQDPSTPAFALPFQDINTDNHTAQWAERAPIID